MVFQVTNMKDDLDENDLLFSNAAYEAKSIGHLNLKLTSASQKILNQGELNSCTACAVTTLLSFKLNIKEPLSILFIYYNARIDKSKDTGASLRNTLKGISKHGIVPSSKWPFDNIMRFNKQPPQNVYDSAIKLRFKYYKIVTLQDMKNCISNGMPFVFNLVIFNNFYESGSVLDLPRKNHKVIGRHAMICTGFNDLTKMFTVQNSMGVGWGDNGFIEIPYAYLTEPKLCGDIWTII